MQIRHALGFPESRIFLDRCYHLCRGVAQPGSALRSGRRGRRFKSYHLDHCLQRFTAIL